jgi:hypothetical protein
MNSRAAFLIRCEIVAALRDAGRSVADVGAIMRLTKDNVRRHAARAARERAKSAP